MKAFFVFMLLTTVTGFGAKPQGKTLFESFEYDFATSSATSATPHRFTTLPTGAVVRNVWMTVTTQVSPSAMSIDIGTDNDPDGYLGTLVGSDTVTYTAHSAASKDSALLWDGTNDHLIPYVIITSATDGVIEAEFDNDPTQGKFEIHVEYFIPENSDD